MVSQEQEQQEKQEQQIAERAKREEQPVKELQSSAEQVQQASSSEEAQGVARDDVLEQPRKKGKKRRIVRKERHYTAAELEAASPRPSFWPIVLALSLVVFLLGAIGSSPILLGAGIVLIVICAIGWSLEHR